MEWRIRLPWFSKLLSSIGDSRPPSKEWERYARMVDDDGYPYMRRWNGIDWDLRQMNDDERAEWRADMAW